LGTLAVSSSTSDINARDNATGVINGVKSALASIPRTVTTTIQTNYTSTQSASSPSPYTTAGLADGGIMSFYAGGGIREQHVAQIAPAGAWRVWAEPETGGEAYIPLAAGKRDRSEAILEQVAHIFGRRIMPMASGGIIGGRAVGGGGIIVNAPIDIAVSGAQNPAETARMVGDVVDEKLERFADKLDLAVARR